MGWNYRLVCRSDEDPIKTDIFIELHEVFYNGYGLPWSRTEEPILSCCLTLGEGMTEEEAIKDLKGEVLSMLKAFDAPLLDDSAIREENTPDFKFESDTSRQTGMGSG